MDIRQILGNPDVYSMFDALVGGDARKTYASQYIRARSNDRVLDIGCGPGDILNHLPNGVDYTGFDISPAYIEAAQRRFGLRGRFMCREVSQDLVREFSGLDLVLANGVLHHLTDSQVIQLFQIARAALQSDGRLVTWDGCFVEAQSRVARFLLRRDRGRFVRTEKAYTALARQVFSQVSSTIRHDLLRIPYTHIIMECRP
ncbi:MAG: class I SAM-dependent methyltransferase [Pyrinomonadaceae bacterium]